MVWFLGLFCGGFWFGSDLLPIFVCWLVVACLCLWVACGFCRVGCLNWVALVLLLVLIVACLIVSIVVDSGFGVDWLLYVVNSVVLVMFFLLCV